MTVYVNQYTQIQWLGAAGPYGALILAAPRTAIPYGARRGVLAVDLWGPTAGGVLGSPTVRVSLLPPNPTNATIQAYLQGNAWIVPPPDVTHYVLWAQFAAPVDPEFVAVSWEVSGQ